MRTQSVITASQPKIGQLIRAVRLELKLTQEQFAHQLGVTFPTISRWENAKTTPSPLGIKVIEGKVAELGKRGRELVQEYFG